MQKLILPYSNLHDFPVFFEAQSPKNLPCQNMSWDCATIYVTEGFSCCAFNKTRKLKFLTSFKHQTVTHYFAKTAVFEKT